MIPLKDKVNVYPDTTPNYPFGSAKDDDGSNNGTPVDRATLDDYYQFFEMLMYNSGLTPNGLPDNLANGFQLYQALILWLRMQTATDSTPGVAEIATLAEVLAGTDFERIITPLRLEGWWEAVFNQVWVSRSNVADITPVGGSTVVVTGSNMKYKVIGKTMHLIFTFSITNVTAPTSFTMLIPGTFVRVVADFNKHIPCVIFDASFQTFGRISMRTVGTASTIEIFPASALTDTHVISVSGELTFEII